MSDAIVLAQGTATLANTKLSLAANYGFFDIGVDLSQFIGNTIEITNATAPKYSIRGIISTVGTGETLSGSELFTNANFDLGDTGWTKEAGWTIVDQGAGDYEGVATNSGLYQRVSQAITNTIGVLYKGSFVVTNYTSGRVAFRTNPGPVERFGTQLTGTGTSTLYFTGVSGVGSSTGPWATQASTTLRVDDCTLQQVVTPSSTGHWIKSAPGATDGVAWSYKHASFNPNDSAGFTYRILSTNIPGQQIASGTVSATDVKLATVDGGSMVDITGLNFSDITDEGWIKKLVPTMWLRAEDLTATLGDGDAVTTWTDKSGNSYNATQSVVDNKPTLQTSEINGKAVVRFDGTNDYLSLAMTNSVSNYTFFIVAKPTIKGPAAYSYFFDSQTGRLVLFCENSTEYKYGYMYSSGDYLLISTPTNTNQIFTFSLGTTGKVYKNGTLVGTGAYNQTAIGGATRIGITYNSGTLGAYSGDIAEIIVFNRALSDAERNQVEKSLSAYYGITLASSNPVPSSFVGVDSYSPPSTNLQLHLKADAGCFTDAGKTTACASDADKVYVWADQSGNGNDAVQATEGNRPLWKTNIVGTLPAIRFDGSDDYLATGAISNLETSTQSIYMVVKSRVTPVVTSHIYVRSNYTSGAGSNSNSLCGAFSNTTSSMVYTRVSDGTMKYAPKPFSTALNLMSSVWNGTTYFKGYFSGMQLSGIVTGANASPTTHVKTVIGIDSADMSSYCLDGDIYEILIYNAAHDDITRTQIERYLAGKWGISYTPTVYGTSPAKYLLALYDSSGRVATGYTGNSDLVTVTAVNLHSTNNAYDRKMKIVSSGFDSSNITKYKIYALTGGENIPFMYLENNLQLQDEGNGYIYSKEG